VSQLAAGLNAMPRNQLFLLLLGLAVLLKLLQSLAMYLGSLAMGYYSARTSSRLMAMIHSHILGFSFACASRYRVGDLVYVANAGPGDVMNEVNNVSAITLTLLMMFTYLVVLLSLSPWLLVSALLMGELLSLVQQQLLPRIRKRSFVETELERDLSSRITENIQGLRLLHASGSIATSLAALNPNAALLNLLNKLLEPAGKQFRRRRSGLAFKSLQQNIIV
jgi:ATP-binding cassette subfamily B protein/subfamily B ATP-binding cassette protein MsbA